MLLSLVNFLRRLQAVARLTQHLGDLMLARGEALRLQLGRERPGALARPAQRRLGVASRHWVHQRLQRLVDAGLLRLDGRSSGPLPSNVHQFDGALLRPHFLLSIEHSAPPEAGRASDQFTPTIAVRQRLRTRPQSQRAFIEVRLHQHVALPDLFLGGHPPPSITSAGSCRSPRRPRNSISGPYLLG